MTLLTLTMLFMLGISAMSMQSSTGGEAGPLSGDSLARRIQRDLRNYTSHIYKRL